MDKNTVGKYSPCLLYTSTNEFEEGMYCDSAYNEVYDANRRVCERLDVEEDDDVECIISNLLGIAKHISMKMYDYGEYYACLLYTSRCV